MGFWHTGYIEFHEPTGGLESYFYGPIQYRCGECDCLFDSTDELRHHRFEQHPLRRPVLLIRGKEVGSQTFHIARTLVPSDVQFGNCEDVYLNGTSVSIADLPELLAQLRTDTCNLRLAKDGIDAEFVLEFRIASAADIEGVENAFLRLASGRRLNTKVVSDFIDGTASYVSAIRYADGISSYLYGVLRREDTLDIPLPMERYIDKFNAATVALADYDRPFARIISGIVGFHLNQFPSVVSIAPQSRVGAAAAHFADLIDANRISRANAEDSQWERMITDLQTERIVKWAVEPPRALTAMIDEMETVLRSEPTELDRPKLHVLLGEAYIAANQPADARRHAAELRNVPVFERWAEAIIQKCS